MNNTRGKKKKQVKLANKYLVAHLSNSYEWETHVGLSALHQKDCNGKGKHKAFDGSLACYLC